MSTLPPAFGLDWRARGHTGWWAFALHRLSGIALTVFLPAHFFVLSRALTGEASLDTFLRWTDQPLVKVGDHGGLEVGQGPLRLVDGSGPAEQAVHAEHRGAQRQLQRGQAGERLGGEHHQVAGLTELVDVVGVGDLLDGLQLDLRGLPQGGGEQGGRLPGPHHERRLQRAGVLARERDGSPEVVGHDALPGGGHAGRAHGMLHRRVRAGPEPNGGDARLLPGGSRGLLGATG